MCLPRAAVRQRFLSSPSTSNILVCLQLRKQAERVSLVLLLFVLGAGFFGLGGFFLGFFYFLSDCITPGLAVPWLPSAYTSCWPGPFPKLHCGASAYRHFLLLLQQRCASKLTFPELNRCRKPEFFLPLSMSTRWLKQTGGTGRLPENQWLFCGQKKYLAFDKLVTV